MEFETVTVQDLVDFCKEHNLSTDTVIMLDEVDNARPFTEIKVNKGVDGKHEPVIELF